MKISSFFKNLSLQQKASLLTVSGMAISRFIFYSTQIALMILFLPSQFGVIAVITAAIAFANAISALGVDAAIISRERVNKHFLTAAWCVDLIRGSILTSIFLFFGPTIGANVLPGTELGLMIQIVGFIFLINSFRNIGIVCLRKELKFKKLILLDLVMILINCVVTLSIAFFYKTIWAVIFGQLAGAFSYSILSYFLHEFRFYKYSPRGYFLEVISFSKWIIFGAQINAFLENGLTFFIASVFGATQVAYFDRSDLLTRKTSQQIGEVFWKVGMPIFAKNSNDINILRENYLKALYIISVSSGILMAIIYLIFKNYTLNIFGESWVGIIDLIPIFAFVGWLSTLYSVNSIYYQATGIPKIGVKFTLIRFVTTSICLFPLVNVYEVKGLVLALLIGLFVTLIFIFNDISKRIRTSNIEIVRELFAGIIPALILIAILQIVNIESLAIGILLIFFMGILSTTIFYKKIKLSLDF